ncbi:MAG: hypothetical protein DMD97_25255 [Candidatus Rokuibacteriota bacterium]|nr:MAG: hypothetical protein DMD97_25255 [Candidatus Rokubacteria bacterium]
MRIETWRVGGDRGEQHTAASWRLRCARRRSQRDEDSDRDRGREDDECAMAPHDLDPPPSATITPPAAEVKRRANTKGADSRPRGPARITTTLTRA